MEKEKISFEKGKNGPYGKRKFAEDIEDFELIVDDANDLNAAKSENFELEVDDANDISLSEHRCEGIPNYSLERAEDKLEDRPSCSIQNELRYKSHENSNAQHLEARLALKVQNEEEIQYCDKETAVTQADNHLQHVQDFVDIFDKDDFALSTEVDDTPMIDENIELNCNDEEEFFLDEENYDDDDDESTNGSSDSDSDFLYPGCSVTVGAFMLLLALFTMKHNVTGDGIQLLLGIISLVLPVGHQLCTSLETFKKFFRNLKNPLVKHFYCELCLNYLENENMKTCSNASCNKNVEKNKPYFLEIPLISQLQTLFSQEGFFEKLQHRFKKQQSNGYEDIYDGSLYQSYVENNGPLSKPENISFMFNTDGAPVFKSSKVSIWPLYLAINELPYRTRMKNENMLLAGLWFGKQKPCMSTFLRPFQKSMTQLSDGIEVKTPGKGSFKCKAFLLAGTADLPARCLLCNSIQYNGSFGCWKCLQKGETAAVGKGHTHVFPYVDETPKGPIRTRESVIRDAKQVITNKQNRGPTTVNGVKG